MLKLKIFHLVVWVALLAGLLSCQAAAPAVSPQSAPAESRAEEAFYSDENAATSGGAAAPGKADAASAERLVIRNASMNIAVDDPAATLEVISGMAETMGGFVVSQNLYKTNSDNGIRYPEATITIRVPAEKLNEAMAQIRAQVKDPDEDILSENVSGQDVTAEYTDLRSRLKNLQASEEQLREIMGSASKTEDVLAVQQQLTQVREQIEVIQGQIEYYEEAAALSSIAVNIQARASIQPLEVGGWQPVGVARDAIQALIFALQALASIAIWGILFLLPVGVVIILPIVVVVWLIRRGSKRRKNPPSPEVKS